MSAMQPMKPEREVNIIVTIRKASVRLPELFPTETCVLAEFRDCTRFYAV